MLIWILASGAFQCLYAECVAHRMSPAVAALTPASREPLLAATPPAGRTQGASSGSARNVPNQRTVVSCRSGS